MEDNTAVKKIEGLNQSYVTKYFSESSDLSAAFKTIIGETLLQSKYFPTLVAESEHLSGYVSFVDRVGRYMEVIDMKGILIHDDLFSGAELASNFASKDSKGAFSTIGESTELGATMLEAVMKRLGIEDADTARTVISLAHQYGQLGYQNEDNYSNYIGWYANAKGEFLGFYHEGVTTLPAATGNADTDPAYVVKSYGYFGEVDAEHGVAKSDMMFAIVQVREDIKTREQMVSFGVPAALIPVVTYEVTLDENQNLENLEVSGATAPIRLVYEVALKEEIDSISIHETVDADYIATNTENGKVNFYVSQYAVDNKTGYNTLNAYSYFNPSHQNERYYYTENSKVYVDNNGTLYAGGANSAPDPDKTYYRAFTVYSNNGSLQKKTEYEKISSVSLKKARYDSAGGYWYIPQNAVHTYTEGYTVYMSDADWASRKFSFKLEEWDGNSWTTLESAEATDAARDFEFKNAFLGKAYGGAGVYYYRISETIGGDKGVTYDRTVHAFTITVEDKELDGALEVIAVTPQRETVHVNKTASGWDVKADFTNTYSVEGTATYRC